MRGSADSASYDVIAEYYDCDMAANNPGKDISFYVDWALWGGRRVLELGCGTGRITIPLVKAGCEAVGIDLSRRMLEQLERKRRVSLTAEQNARLKCHRLDMRHFALQQKFPLIICPFAAFTYLVEEADRLSCLEAIKRHLTDNGVFIVDSFVPRQDIQRLPDDHVFNDYRREIAPGLFLDRRKTIQKDPSAQVNLITRHYRLLTAGDRLLREFSTREKIRYFFHEELALLLRTSGFRILEAYGDYQSRPFGPDARMMVFVTALVSRPCGKGCDGLAKAQCHLL